MFNLKLGTDILKTAVVALAGNALAKVAATAFKDGREGVKKMKLEDLF